MGFITPPSAETPTTSDGDEERHPAPQSSPSATAEDNNISEYNNFNAISDTKSESAQSRTNPKDIPRTLNTNEEVPEDTESSGMQPPWLTDDDDEDSQDYDNSVDIYSNNIVKDVNKDTSNALVNSKKLKRLHDDTDARRNHVDFMDNYDSTMESFDTFNKFEAIDANERDKTDTEIAADSSPPAIARPCQADCGKSCPYGYKVMLPWLLNNMSCS